MTSETTNTKATRSEQARLASRDRPFDAESILRMCIAHLPDTLVTVDVDGAAQSRVPCDEPSQGRRHLAPALSQDTSSESLVQRSRSTRPHDAGSAASVGMAHAEGFALAEASPHIVQLSAGNGTGLACEPTAHAPLHEHAPYFDLLFREAATGMALCDLEGSVLKVNQALCRFFGKDPAALQRGTILQFWGASAQEDRDGLAGLMAGRCHLYRAERQFACGEPQLRWGFVSAMLLRDGNDVAVRVLIQVEDISERKYAEESVRLASLVYQHSSESMMVTDASHVIVSINAAFTHMTGYAAHEVIGKNPRMLSSGRHDKAFYEAMWQSVLKHGRWEGEIWNRRKNGELYVAWISITVSYNEDGSVHRRLALFSDITNRKRSEELVWSQANFDALTGLPNRRLFQDRLEQEIRKAHRSGSTMALMFLDLDRFKEINDSLGHDQGDLLLKEAGARLKGSVRESDIVARLGGDEFTVILGELSEPGDAARIAQGILQKMAAAFQLDMAQAFVSASIGIALYPQDACSAVQLVKHADEAMYVSKHSGGNCFNYFTSSMQRAAANRIWLANDLRSALAQGELLLDFLPIAELGSGTVRKAEAVARWRHPQRGTVEAEEFFPIAEATGMIGPLGEWLFLQAAARAACWHSMDAGLQVCVNLTALHSRSCRNCVADWLAHARALELPPRCMALELSEGMLADGPDITSELRELRSGGLDTIVDHFGVGRSSLSFLKKHAVAGIKIDASLVGGLAAGSDQLVLCEAIIAMAHKLGLEVIAQGVENEMQRTLLVQAGCDYGQGRLFRFPERWVAAATPQAAKKLRRSKSIVRKVERALNN